MNKVIQMGHLTRDPEMRYSQSATPVAVANYGIAVRRPFAKQGEPDVDFFNVTSFGKAAEFVEKFFHKGDMISVVGRLQTESWTDAQQVKRTGIKIIAEEQHFCGSKGNGGAGAAPAGQSAPASKPQQGFVPAEIPDDDLPF